MKRVGLMGAVVLALAIATAAVAASSGWKVQRSPSPRGAMDSHLEGVSCASRTACAAVGQYTKDFSTYLTLAEGWNGEKWSIKPTRTPGGTYGDLQGVSCAGVRACIAVGEHEISGEDVVLAERWNGKKWSLLHPPSPAGAVSSGFRGVFCTSPSACTAVGFFQTGSAPQTLVERWNGTRWSVEPTPNPSGATLSELNAVICTARSACTAVGTSRNGSAVWTTLAERWNGKKWSIQTTRNPSGATTSELNGVSCTSASVCIAAGSYEKTNNHNRTLAERWNGRKWSILHTLNPTTDPNKFLLGVSCTSARSCTATGYTSGPIVWQATLVEHWNGSKWSVQSSPHPGTDSQLQAVSCSPTTACTAVGQYRNGGPTKTLVEHR